MSAEESFVNSIAEAVAARIPASQSVELAFDDLGIEPMKLYTAEETAHVLGCHVTSVRQLSAAELPKQRRVGKGIGYYGINILLYQNEMPPINMTGWLEDYREALMRDRPVLGELRSDERERRRDV